MQRGVSCMRGNEEASVIQCVQEDKFELAVKNFLRVKGAFEIKINAVNSLLGNLSKKLKENNALAQQDGFKKLCEALFTVIDKPKFIGRDYRFADGFNLIRHLGIIKTIDWNGEQALKILSKQMLELIKSMRFIKDIKKFSLEDTTNILIFYSLAVQQYTLDTMTSFFPDSVINKLSGRFLLDMDKLNPEQLVFLWEHLTKDPVFYRSEDFLKRLVERTNLLDPSHFKVPDAISILSNMIKLPIDIKEIHFIKLIVLISENEKEIFKDENRVSHLFFALEVLIFSRQIKHPSKEFDLLSGLSEKLLNHLCKLKSNQALSLNVKLNVLVAARAYQLRTNSNSAHIISLCRSDVESTENATWTIPIPEYDLFEKINKSGYEAEMRMVSFEKYGITIPKLKLHIEIVDTACYYLPYVNPLRLPAYCELEDYVDEWLEGFKRLRIPREFFKRDKELFFKFILNEIARIKNGEIESKDDGFQKQINKAVDAIFKEKRIELEAFPESLEFKEIKQLDDLQVFASDTSQGQKRELTVENPSNETKPEEPSSLPNMVQWLNRNSTVADQKNIPLPPGLVLFISSVWQRRLTPPFVAQDSQFLSPDPDQVTQVRQYQLF